MTYKPDIRTSGEIGVFSDGIPVTQTSNQTRMFFILIEEYEIKTFIELGVAYGGLANLMLKYGNEYKDFSYYGFEIDQNQIRPPMQNRPEIMITDVFSQVCQDRVKSVIENSVGHVLVLCDGGNKSREMVMYAPMLRVGDLMMGHDYPGEITDTFLDDFGANHPDLEEVWHTYLRAQNGASLWRKVK